MRRRPRRLSLRQRSSRFGRRRAAQRSSSLSPTVVGSRSQQPSMRARSSDCSRSWTTLIPSAVRIFVCTEPVACARGLIASRSGHGHARSSVRIRRTAASVRVRESTRVEAQGAVPSATETRVLYKRLHRAVFDLPLAGAGSASVHIDAPALAKLLAGRAREEASKRTRKS